MKTLHVLGGLWLTTLSLVAGAGSGAHEHGRARLSLVQQGAAITVSFESPLDNLVGFEHAPKTGAQKHALTQARTALENAVQVAGLPAAAGCVVKSVTVDLPFGDAAHADQGEHADADAEYVFDCAQPSAATQVTVGLFKVFPRLQRIDAEAATATGQGKAVLRPAQATWALPAAR